MAESVQIQSMSHRHMAIADWLLANPERKQRECAEAFGVSEAWISIVKNSDVFREYFAKRRDAHDEDLRQQLNGELLQTAVLAQKTLRKVLEMDNVDQRVALDAATKTVEAIFPARPSARTKFVEEQERKFLAPVSSECFDFTTTNAQYCALIEDSLETGGVCRPEMPDPGPE